MVTKLKQNTLVMKFGGTSVGPIDGLNHVEQIVRQANREWQRVVVVSSAFSKVTDALLESARQAPKETRSHFKKLWKCSANVITRP